MNEIFDVNPINVSSSLYIKQKHDLKLHILKGILRDITLCEANIFVGDIRKDIT